MAYQQVQVLLMDLADPGPVVSDYSYQVQVMFLSTIVAWAGYLLPGGIAHLLSVDTSVILMSLNAISFLPCRLVYPQDTNCLMLRARLGTTSTKDP
jgi:hypothetical protein